MPVSSSEPDRRAVVHGLLAVTGLTALGACGGTPGSAPPRSSPVAETASPSRAPGTGDPGAIATSPSPEPGTPSRDEIIAEFTGRAPAWFDLVGEGIASDTRAAGVCLTLDACGGPGGSGADTALVDMLIGDSVPFTAFLNSRWVEANPDLTDRLAACETVEIANHGTAHLPMSVTGAAAYGIPGTRDAGEVWDEIMGNQVALTAPAPPTGTTSPWRSPPAWACGPPDSRSTAMAAPPSPPAPSRRRCGGRAPATSSSPT